MAVRTVSSNVPGAVRGGLWHLEEVGARGADAFGVSSVVVLQVALVSGAVGIALRLYTLNATIFDFHKTGTNFQRIFLLVLVLDLVWAMSPFLIVHKIGLGLAFASCAALVYSPFAQRMLGWMTWGKQSSVISSQ